MEERGEHRGRCNCSKTNCAHGGGDSDDFMAGGNCSFSSRSSVGVGHCPPPVMSTKLDGRSRRRPGEEEVRNWGSWARWLASRPCLDVPHWAHSGQFTKVRRIQQLSDGSASPSSHTHFSETIVCSQLPAQAPADDTLAQHSTSRLQSHPRGTRSGSSSGSGSHGFLLAIFLLATLLPMAMANIVAGSVTLIPSGVLQMTAYWNDSPKTGAT